MKLNFEIEPNELIKVFETIREFNNSDNEYAVKKSREEAKKDMITEVIKTINNSNTKTNPKRGIYAAGIS